VRALIFCLLLSGCGTATGILNEEGRVFGATLHVPIPVTQAWWWKYVE